MAFNAQNTIDQVCFYRGLPPIKKGQQCEVDGKKGRIVGGNHSANFNVLFDGESRPKNCHPDWKMVIFNGDGSVLHQSNE